MPETAAETKAPEPRLRQHGGRQERTWRGPAFLSHGFRPFFLGATLFAAIAVALWLHLLQSGGTLPVYLAPVDWHRHEMLFGYASAAIAGFLFTAVPNWTGRLPVTGVPLAALFLLWIAGRIALLVPLPVPLAVLIDAAFLPFLFALIGREIIAGRNWRNLKVLVPVAIFGAGNIWFHAEMLTGGKGDGPVRLGFAAILMLIMLIGGRITPSFTRNWLVRQGQGRLPVPFGRLDGAVLGLSALGLAAWVILGTAPELALPFTLLALLHLWRQARWAPERCWPNPLLLILHAFHATIPLALALMALAAAGGDPALRIAALHAFGIGSVGGMTLSVMTRASLGHTGRALVATPAINGMMLLLGASLGFRLSGAVLPGAGWAITASGLAWIAAFALFVLHVGPWLLTPRHRKPDSDRPGS